MFRMHARQGMERDIIYQHIRQVTDPSHKKDGPTMKVQGNMGSAPPGQQQQYEWSKALTDHHIIAAVRNLDAVTMAINSPTRVVYLLFGNPMNIADITQRMRENGKLPLVNLDLLVGFSKDAYAVEYLASCGIGGIISTHNESLRAARALGLITVLRTFAIDSSAVEAGLRSINHFQADAVEVLPAIAAPLIVRRYRGAFPNLRIIGGGLVSTLKEIDLLIAAGIDAVSVSDPVLWVL